jgi:REP element-mobilizing transposase RayT
MPSSKTPLLSNRLYHLYTHANGDESLFRQEANYHYFLKLYAQHVHPVVKTYAYCLLPNHVHFMVRVREVDVL